MITASTILRASPDTSCVESAAGAAASAGSVGGDMGQYHGMQNALWPRLRTPRGDDIDVARAVPYTRAGAQHMETNVSKGGSEQRQSGSEQSQTALAQPVQKAQRRKTLRE